MRFPRIVPDRYLISVALNRRHLTEGQKAVLANNYREILSKKTKEQRAEIAVIQREINRGNILGETVSSKINEEQERSRKIVAEKWKVSEWKVRIAHEIEKETINIKWHSNNLSDVITVISSDKDEVSDSRKTIGAR